MADDADIANNIIDAEVLRALGKIQQLPDATKPGPKYCPICEQEIAKERRELGFKLCIDCAAETERKQSMFAD